MSEVRQMDGRREPTWQGYLRSDGRLGIRNMSSEPWNAVTTKGVNRKVEPNGVIPLKAGIRFRSNDSTITINGGE